MNFSIGKRLKNFLKIKVYYFSKKIKNLYRKNEIQEGETSGYKRWYFPNGAIKAEFYVINGKVEGIANLFYESGAIKAKEFYKADKLNGLSKWYYESGELKSEKYYKDGILTSSKDYDKNGNVILQ